MEEKGKVSEAVICYEKGLKLVNTALQLSGANDNDLEACESIRNKLEKIKIDCEYRLRILKPQITPQAEPSAPPALESQCNGNSNLNVVDGQFKNGRVLITVDEGVKLFHIDSKGSVSTWSMPCNLKIVQLPGDSKDPNVPPAFMQCGEWIYPLHPGKSPALKSFDRTYLFPDINLMHQNDVPASIGIVFEDSVSEALVERFERGLSCYCDFRKYSKDDRPQKPLRPPPPYQLKEGSQEDVPRDTTMELALVPAFHSETAAVSVGDDNEQSWSQKVSNGILVGAKWASWGLSKGAEITSNYVEKGAVKLREKMQPNVEPTKVSPEVSKNVQQIREVTGAAVQVSTFLVATLCTLTIELGKQLAPTIRAQGSKLIPEKYKNDGENGKKTMDDIIMVASAGLKGFGTVFTSLEESGKALYASLTKATVDTVNHKYGHEASDVTGEAMAAAGNTAQAYWNVKKLGAKAIAKRAAKDTSKAVLLDAEEQIKSNTNKAIKY